MNRPVAAWPWARLQLARALSWALLLGGWIGLGSVSWMLAPSVGLGFALVAAWLLGLGGVAQGLRRWPPTRPALRGGLVLASVSAAVASWAAAQGGGATLLLLAWLSWAALVALASVIARACRRALPGRAAPPVWAAAVGALLVWAGLGDPSVLHALMPRLVGGQLVISLLLLGLVPSQLASSGHCRSGLLDCALPRWGRADGRPWARWPLALAALVMLPMMVGLPMMQDLCRADGVSAQTVLAGHLAAMFVPALLLLRWRPWLRHAATVCTLLLAAGALALLLAPGVLGWWLLVLCHGSAWGAAWVAHLQSPGPAPGGGEEPAPLLSAAVSASLVLALGLGVSLLGAAALSGGHLALAGVAILAWLATPSAAHRPA